MQLLGSVVIHEHVQREDVAQRLQREVARQQVRHGGVVDGQHRDGQAAVDFAGEARRRQVVVELGELGVLRQDLGDVVGPACLRRREEQHEEEREEELSRSEHGDGECGTAGAGHCRGGERERMGHRRRRGGEKEGRREREE